MHVGRDVPDHLASKVVNGLGLVAGERFELIVRLDGRRPDADFLVVTNARVAAVRSDDVPARRIRLQVLADELQAWRLTRKVRSRLTVTSGFGATSVMARGFAAYDDDTVDAALTALVAGRADPLVAKALTALRAQAHWVSSPYGRSVHVLDRSAVTSPVDDRIDLSMIDMHLRHCDYWPASEARRHVAACLPAGGCFLARTPGSASVGAAAEQLAAALVPVDAIKLRKSSGAEAGIVDRLMTAVAHIRSSPAWTSPRANDAHVDVNDDVREIALTAHRAAELRAALGERPKGTSQTARRAGEVYDVSMASLDAVADRLTERVQALESYRDRLRAVARELRDLEGAEQIDRLAEKVTALAAASVPGDGVVADDDRDGAVAPVVPLPRESMDGVRRAAPSPDGRRTGSATAVHDAVTALKREADRLGTLMRTNVGTMRQDHDDH
jgi:hypothetical protein